MIEVYQQSKIKRKGGKAMQDLLIPIFCTFEKDKSCGCFYCYKVFDPNEIKDWIKDRNGDTAICPYCGIDSIIGESSGFPITEEFLKKMHNYWF